MYSGLITDSEDVDVPHDDYAELSYADFESVISSLTEEEAELSNIRDQLLTKVTSLEDSINALKRKICVRNLSTPTY